MLFAFKLDYFPRHLVPLVPCIGLVRLGPSSNCWTGWPVGTFIRRSCSYHSLRILPLCVDGERSFLKDPRAAAAGWILANVPPGESLWWDRKRGFEDYEHAGFPDERTPSVLVIEMLDANHYLSGIGRRDSYPSDYRSIFDSLSQQRIDTLQAVFRGESEFVEAAPCRTLFS